MSSPRPVSSGFQIAHSNASDTHVDSPLRKESFPHDAAGKAEFEGTLSRSLDAPSDSALSSEIEDEDVIHVDDPGRRYNKIYGGDNAMQSSEDLGTHTEVEEDDDHYGAPILASDEVAKEPFGWELLPAVSPSERRGSADMYHHKSGSASSLNNSRPSSIHGNVPSLRLPESTPLEDLDEYEPLFPEDHSTDAQKPLTPADKLKSRPDLKKRKFPSQDIWEDSPNSLQYTAEVSTPQLPEEDAEELPVAPSPETAAQAFARRQEELAERESRDSESFLNREKKPWNYKPHLPTHVAAETRPGMKQRFPSRDIWEDTPDSLQLETTVTGPQSEEETMSPASATQEKGAGIPPTEAIAIPSKPQIPARPVKSKLSESPEKSHPAIPERPQRLRQVDGADGAPLAPTKSKPQVPARPSKPIARDSSENVPLTTVLSNSSARSVGSDTTAAAAAKPKPPVPARPMGSKIAALQGGFMADLNKRLQLGAQPLKKEEPASEEKEEEKEKVPLVDARKGRARGPARRAPAKSPSPAVAEPTSVAPSANLVFSMLSTSWEIDPEDDYVHVVLPEQETATSRPATKASQSETPTLATNTAGEAVHEPSEIAPGAEKASSLPSATEHSYADEADGEEKEFVALEHESAPVKKSDEPAVAPIKNELLAREFEDDEDLTASTATLKPEKE